MLEGAAQPTLPQNAEHCGRRMSEGPKLLPEQPEDEVLGADEQTRSGVARRIAEHEQTASAVRSRSEEALVVRVTADHPVQHDDIGGLDTLRVGGDVVDPSFCTVLERCLA